MELKNRNILNPDCTKLTLGCSDKEAKKRLFITVCIHGDETCGLNAVNELLEEGFFEKGFDSKNVQVNILLGNPKAVIEKKRFIDVNLNRIFTSQYIEQNLKSNFNPNAPYEDSRLSEIIQEIEKCDYYLDLHSTSAPTQPFAIVTPDPESESIAKNFPVKFVLHNVIRVIFGTSIDYAHLFKKPAICVECGQHQARSTVDIAKETIKSFITGMDLNSSENISMNDSTSPDVLWVDKSVILKNGFHFHKRVKAFDWVNHDELVAADRESGELRCPYKQGAYLIMPIANPVVGEEAWLWGHSDADADGRISSS